MNQEPNSTSHTSGLHNILTEDMWFSFVQGKKLKSKISHFIWQRSILRPSVDIQHADTQNYC